MPTKEKENIFVEFADELKGTDQISQEQIEKVHGGDRFRGEDQGCPQCARVYRVGDLESTKGKCLDCGTRVFPESNYEEDSGCVLAGTLITMADHTTKKVEDVKNGESVLCWDFEIGQFVEEKVIHNFHADDKATMSNIIELEFEEENKLSIVNVHSLFDISKAKYVEINENASEFIGDEFAIQDGYKFKAVKLLKAEVYRDVVNFYSPITYKNINCLTNGFISIPGYFPIICNNYDVDVSELKFVNQKSDNEKYGLATYEELKELGSPRLYDVLNAEIVKIALAKNGKSIKDIAKILKSFKSEIDRI